MRLKFVEYALGPRAAVVASGAHGPVARSVAESDAFLDRLEAEELAGVLDAIETITRADHLHMARD
jgi:hypothetical protein